MTQAAKRLLSGYRRLDGRPTIVGTVVDNVPVAVVVGLAAYVARGPLGLSAVSTAVVVIIVLVLASAAAVPLMRAWESIHRSRRFAARWPADATGADATRSGGLADGLAAVQRARRGVAELAAARLVMFGGLGAAGPGLVLACDHDAVMGHLGQTDRNLCLSYAAATRQGTEARHA